MLTETFISRKKHAEIPVQAKDHAGWRHNGSDMPEKVIRSPKDPNKWLTIQEYISLIDSLEAEGAPFRSAKGRKLVFQPYSDGEFAWLNHLGRMSRERCAFIQGLWIPSPKKPSSTVGSMAIDTSGVDDGL